MDTQDSCGCSTISLARSPSTLTQSTPKPNKGPFPILLPTSCYVTQTLSFSPETILILRSISRFESLYLSRSTARLNEAIATSLAGGIRNPPGATEGMAIARVASNELDSARFDVLLVRSVARNVVSAVDVLLGRMNTLVSGYRADLRLRPCR